MSLLKSLGIERDRWQETSEGFKSQMATLVGDVFLSSAFLSYAGYFDQQRYIPRYIFLSFPVFF